MLKELLERWARLEPERCMLDGKGQPHFLLTHDTGQWLDSPVTNASLLAAVIEAVETRQGSWKLECHEVRYRKEPAPKYSAIAHWRVPHDRPVDFNQFANFWASRDGATPAEALLTAHLAVLEAEEEAWGC